MGSSPTGGTMKLFLLWHSHHLEEEQDLKLIGVFSSYENAQEVERYVGTLSGFRGSKEGFSIDELTLDETHWTTGFETV